MDDLDISDHITVEPDEAMDRVDAPEANTSDNPHVETILRPKSVIVSSILSKIEQEFSSLRSIMAVAHDATELARLGMDAIPLARRFAKKRYESLIAKVEKAAGKKYEFDPRELFTTIIEGLTLEAKFDDEEMAYLNENKSILYRMFKSEINEDLLTLNPLDEMPEEIRWDNMHPKLLLNTDLFELLDLPQEEFEKRYKRPLKHEGDEAKMRAKKIEFSADRPGITGEMFQRDVLQHEESLCQKSNDIWREQVELYFDRPEDIDESLFTGRVAEVRDHFELYEILGEFEGLYYRYQSAKTDGERKEIITKVEELDMARRKLLIYLSASTLTQNSQYKYRESVKKYLDEYLQEKIFKVTGSTTVSPTGYPHIKKDVLTAQITDPFTGESVQVYLYEGLNSGKPEDGKSGLVNIKALYKVVMKDLLLDDEDVKDFFRITVMPVNPGELKKMRKVLAATGLISSQSLTKKTIKEQRKSKDNKATSYRDKDIVNYDTTVSPYADSDDRLRRGRIVDTHTEHEGEIVNVGQIDMEVRTGTVDDLVPEDESASHKAYSKLRMEPAWRRLYSPNHYWKNSVSLMYLRQNEIKASMRDENGRTLPGFLAMSYLNAKKKAAEQGGCVGDAIVKGARLCISRALAA